MSNITNKKQEHQMSYRCNCTLSLPSGSSQQYQYKEVEIWKNPKKWKKKKYQVVHNNVHPHTNGGNSHTCDLLNAPNGIHDDDDDDDDDDWYDCHWWW